MGSIEATSQALSRKMSSADVSRVAQTIFDQMGGTRRIALMTGASNFACGVADSGDDAGLAYARFVIPSGARDDIRAVIIAYDAGADLYNMEFWRLAQSASAEERAAGVRVARQTGIYSEQLNTIFEETTGLRLSFRSRPRP